MKHSDKKSHGLLIIGVGDPGKEGQTPLQAALERMREKLAKTKLGDNPDKDAGGISNAG